MADLTRIQLNDPDRRRVERAKRELAEIRADVDTPAPNLRGRLEVIAADLLRILDTDHDQKEN